jgi:sensor histidine kinase YesM
VRSRDEVRILAESFHTMSASIRAYIQGLEEKAELERKLHEEETSLLSMGKALREAQFMNLQDQMRPHFLFNALNSIARNALLEGARTTESLTISLAKLLRATMKEGGPYITLGEEIDIVREYLGFQKVRFKDRFDWEIRFDPVMEGIKVPRFLLQPLVENAVRHGIEPKEERADILISIRQRNDSLQMIVVDTGIGIAPSDLGVLRRKIETAMSEPIPDSIYPSGSFGIGLGNAATRLYLLYGAEASLRVYSRLGKGTLIRLSLPLKGGPRWQGS